MSNNNTINPNNSNNNINIPYQNSAQYEEKYLKNYQKLLQLQQKNNFPPINQTNLQLPPNSNTNKSNSSYNSIAAPAQSSYPQQQQQQPSQNTAEYAELLRQFQNDPINRANNNAAFLLANMKSESNNGLMQSRGIGGNPQNSTPNNVASFTNSVPSYGQFTNNIDNKTNSSALASMFNNGLNQMNQNNQRMIPNNLNNTNSLPSVGSNLEAIKQYLAGNNNPVQPTQPQGINPAQLMQLNQLGALNQAFGTPYLPAMNNPLLGGMGGGLDMASALASLNNANNTNPSTIAMSSILQQQLMFQQLIQLQLQQLQTPVSGVNVNPLAAVLQQQQQLSNSSSVAPGFNNPFAPPSSLPVQSNDHSNALQAPTIPANSATKVLSSTSSPPPPPLSLASTSATLPSITDVNSNSHGAKANPPQAPRLSYEDVMRPYDDQQKPKPFIPSSSSSSSSAAPQHSLKDLAGMISTAAKSIRENAHSIAMNMICRVNGISPEKFMQLQRANRMTIGGVTIGSDNLPVKRKRVIEVEEEVSDGQGGKKKQKVLVDAATGERVDSNQSPSTFEVKVKKVRRKLPPMYDADGNIIPRKRGRPRKDGSNITVSPATAFVPGTRIDLNDSLHKKAGNLVHQIVSGMNSTESVSESKPLDFSAVLDAAAAAAAANQLHDDEDDDEEEDGDEEEEDDDEDGDDEIEILKGEDDDEDDDDQEEEKDEEIEEIDAEEKEVIPSASLSHHTISPPSNAKNSKVKSKDKTTNGSKRKHQVIEEDEEEEEPEVEKVDEVVDDDDELKSELSEEEVKQEETNKKSSQPVPASSAVQLTSSSKKDSKNQNKTQLKAEVPEPVIVDVAMASSTSRSSNKDRKKAADDNTKKQSHSVKEEKIRAEETIEEASRRTTRSSVKTAAPVIPEKKRTRR